MRDLSWHLGHHTGLLLALELGLVTEMFHWKHPRYCPDETIKYLQETLSKEGVQDLGQGGPVAEFH